MADLGSGPAALRFAFFRYFCDFRDPPAKSLVVSGFTEHM